MRSRGGPERCECASLCCWVLCVPFNVVFLRRAKSDPCQPRSEGRLLGLRLWSKEVIFALLVSWERVLSQGARLLWLIRGN